MTSRSATKLLATGWTFAQVPISAMLRKDVSDGAKTLLTYMCWRRNQDGDAWPSIATMAEDMGVTGSTARRRAKELVDRGLAVVTERPGRTSIYHVVADDPRQTPPTSSSDTPSANDTPPCQF